MLKRRVFTGVWIGTVAMLAIMAQAQVYSDAGTVKAVQEKLNEAGFDCGTADGIAGSKTAEAVLAYQNANQLTPSGEIDDALLENMGLLEAEDMTESAAGPETEEEPLSEPVSEMSETAPEADEAVSGAEEAPADPVEDVTIEGTVIYNDNQVAVTAALSQDGQTVEYQVQNASENPVVMLPGDLIANEVTLEAGYDASDYPFILSMNLDIVSSMEDFESYGYGIYVEAGASDSTTVEIDSDLQDIFSYEKVSKLQTSAGVIGLSKELLFDGTDEVSMEDYLFLDAGSLTEVEIPDAQWDGVWTEVDGKVLYEDEQIRLIDLGLMMAGSGNSYFGMVLENRSETSIGVDDVFDSAAVLNGETVEYPYCRGTALPGTRAYCYLNLSMDGIEEETDVTSAYCLLEILNTSYDTLAEVEYSFGSEEDLDASKEKAEEAAEEAEAARMAQAEEERAEEQALLNFTVEEQTIYDGDGFTIKATGAGLNWNGELKLYLEITNDTDTDAGIYFSSVDGQVLGEDSYTYINGFQVSGNAYIQVAAGETIPEEVFLDTFALEAAGIEKIGEIELQFSIINEEYDLIGEMKPSVIRTSAYEEMDTELGEDMKNLYSENGFTVYAKYVEADDNHSAYIVCAIENDSDEAAGLHIDDLKVNGIVNEDFYYFDYELAGRTYVRAFTIDESFLEANSIDQIETLSLCLDVSGPQRGNLTPIFEVDDIDIPLS